MSPAAAFIPGLIVGAFFGFFLGLIVSEETAVARCQGALLEACKRDGGNLLNGNTCVRVERVRVK